MSVATSEIIILEHAVTVMRIPESRPTVELIVQCYYGISGALSDDDGGLMDMIGHSFNYLTREYFALLDTHKIRTFPMYVEVDFDALVEQIKDSFI